MFGSGGIAQDMDLTGRASDVGDCGKSSANITSPLDSTAQMGSLRINTLPASKLETPCPIHYNMTTG
jgi:hypothetical protein